MLDKKERPGLFGELAAAKRLRESGYDIWDANYRCRFGEVDIIAARAGYIVFAEVKTRSPGAIAQAGESVDALKQERIVKTAAVYLSENPCALQPRFDVLEVYLDASMDVRRINHIENAFDSGL